jgi:PTS system nitrogen regulatory IIA component
MEISDLITPDSIFSKLPATSKKQALQELAKRASNISELNER